MGDWQIDYVVHQDADGEPTGVDVFSRGAGTVLAHQRSGPLDALPVAAGRAWYNLRMFAHPL